MLDIYIHIYKYVETLFKYLYMYLVHCLRERSYLIVYTKLQYTNRICKICYMQITIDVIIVM